MDRSRIEDKSSEKGNKRLTPGKFSETTECETNSVNSQKSYEEQKDDTFYIYSRSMDTNSIWNSTSDYKKSASVLSNSLTNNQDSLNSIWSSKYNSNESLTKQDDLCQLPPISIDINEFELHDNNYSSGINENISENLVNQRDMKENFSVEDHKKIAAMINSHDGWGVKPINQNTPWLFPDGENDGDSYPDTFSTWLNDSPNGAYAWEATKKQPGPDWSSNVKSKSYSIPSKQTMWSSGTNDSIWVNPGVYSNCNNAVGSNKPKPNVISGFTAIDTNKSNFMLNSVRNDRTSRIPQEQLKNSCWPTEITPRQMNEFKPMSNSISVDRYTSQRSKPNIDTEIQTYKHCKDILKQIIDQYQKEHRKIQEIDNNLTNLGKLPESRAFINELIRQRQATQQRMQTLRPQHESVVQKMNILEEMIYNFQRTTCGTVTPIDKQFSRPEMNNSSSMPVLDLLANKLSSIQVQSSQDFRLDVPEFVPGKKWHGLSQNGKENRNPTTFNKLCGQYNETCNDSNQETGPYSLTWLFIQNLPSHVTMEMIQSFFIQSNNPCIMPIHSNPFSRWMLIRFPNSYSSQKALQLLSGKIGQPTLISDQDANIKLQELKAI